MAGASRDSTASRPVSTEGCERRLNVIFTLGRSKFDMQISKLADGPVGLGIICQAGSKATIDCFQIMRYRGATSVARRGSIWMGIPQQYSLDVPKRCLDLLALCEKIVVDHEEHSRRHGGPLDTTLLLALASQMILLPIERIMRHLGETVVGYTDDRQLTPGVTEFLNGSVQGRKLRHNAELADFSWSFVPRARIFATSQGLPNDIAEALIDVNAQRAAQDMTMDQFISCFRNSLAHGGIMYLDGEGRSSAQNAEMLLFVSAKQHRPEPFFDATGKIVVPPPVTEALRLIRIPTKEFRHFLAKWVAWLDRGGLAGEIAA